MYYISRENRNGMNSGDEIHKQGDLIFFATLQLLNNVKNLLDVAL